MERKSTLFIQPVGGIAGDMFLGACLDAGLVERDELREVLGKVVDVGGISIEHEQRASVRGVRFSTLLEERGDDHSHVHLKQVFETISKSGLEPGVAGRANAIFDILASAEAGVHGKDKEKAAFHEVGRLDSVADVCGAAYVLEKSTFDSIVCAPLPIGSGVVSCAHGDMPLPGPAVLNILRGAPMYQTDVRGEMVTPTGAAILKHCVSEWGPMPMMQVDYVGYGHGRADWGRVPNSTRLLVGSSFSTAGDTDADLSSQEICSFDRDSIVSIEFNVDDMNPEWVPTAIDGVLAQGALDAYSMAVMGKKGRIAFLFTVLSEDKDFDRISSWLLANTTTAGIRYSRSLRRKLFRESRSVDVDGVSVGIKTLFDKDRRIVRHTIEADSLSEFSKKTGLAPADAHLRIMAALKSEI